MLKGKTEEREKREKKRETFAMKWTRETTRAFVLFYSCVLLAGSSSSVVRHADAYVVPGSFPVDYSLGDDLEGMSK